jgi:hypothetical protein
MVNPTPRKPKLLLFRCSRSTREILRSRLSLTSRSFAKQPLPTCDFQCTRFHLPKLAMARGSTRIFMKVCTRAFVPLPVPLSLAYPGDQAEIIFTLLGEPPFTFTYQRSEPSPKKGGKPGRVLESHTVSRVYSNEYTIYSALEGSYSCYCSSVRRGS